MIKKLSIRNFALIDSLEIDFFSEFSVITGETGAGKSIILGALSLILGQRADSRSVKDENHKAVIEGIFDISAYDIHNFFDKNDLEYDAGNCILRRELQASGKSRAFINDTPVSLVLLKELGEKLIDIHSQYQNLLLGNDRFQLQVVDVWGKNRDLLNRYRHEYVSYKSMQKELERMRAETAANRKEEDYLRFQSEQLEEARLEEGEQEVLEQEQELLEHAGEIKGELYALGQLTSGEEAGILQQLKFALSRLQSLSKLYPDAEELASRIQSAYIDLKDVSAEINDREESVIIDPERLRFVQERLDTIYRLQQKHQVKTVSDLLEIKQSIDDKLQAIDNSDENFIRLEKEIALRLEKLDKIAKELSVKREKAAIEFSTLLVDKASGLGMPNLRFEIELLPHDLLDENGAEQVRFLFSANKNQSLQPVSDVASGGEISRIMLCVKSLIASAVALPTIIFDEVDTGVSGEIADKMAGIMQEMGDYMQVISITHLPQVASKGKHHYRVYKTDDEKGTVTQIVRLNEKERVEEVARMLSGSQLTDEALSNAKVLLGKK